MNARCLAAEGRLRVRRAEVWLGTLVDITASAKTRQIIDDGLRAAFATVARVHRALSGHDATSELTRINRAGPRTKQAISGDFRAVMASALDLAARSNGAFDPTIGCDMTALGFLPSFAASDRGATWRDVVLDSEGVRFARPLLLDFGGIAKGYAVDCAIDALRETGVSQAVVNAGGDMRIYGSNPEIIELRTGGPQSARLPLIAIRDGALATSAYGSRRRVRGRFATPLINPRNRLPSMTTRTVSVAAPTCMVADALTKVVALEGERASRLLDAYDASAAIVSPRRGRWRCTRLPR